MDWFESGFSLAKPPISRRNLSFGQAVDRTSDATLHYILTKVQQITELHVTELQIGQKLLLVGVRDSLDGLQFDDHFALDNDVSPEAFVEANAPAHYGDRHLAFRAEPSLPDVIQKDDLVDRLQQSWAKFPMNRNRSVHDFFAYTVFIHLCDLCAFARVNSSVFERNHHQRPKRSVGRPGEWTGSNPVFLSQSRQDR